MNQVEILEKLQAEFSAYQDLSNSFEEARFFKQPHAEKWSVAQNLMHLIDVSKRIGGSLKDPSVLAQFGTAERPSRDFDTIKNTYQTELKARQALGMPYRHLDTEGVSKTELLNSFNEINQKLMDRTAQLSETDLDTLQMPHPLLGIMTLREMLQFTAGHVRHHFDIIEKMA